MISKSVLIHLLCDSEVLLKFPDAHYSYCFHFDNFLIQQDLFRLVCHPRLNRGCLSGSGKRSLPHTYQHLTSEDLPTTTTKTRFTHLTLSREQCEV